MGSFLHLSIAHHGEPPVGTPTLGERAASCGLVALCRGFAKSLQLKLLAGDELSTEAEASWRESYGRIFDWRWLRMVEVGWDWLRLVEVGLSCSVLARGCEAKHWWLSSITDNHQQAIVFNSETSVLLDQQCPIHQQDMTSISNDQNQYQPLWTLVINELILNHEEKLSPVNQLTSHMYFHNWWWRSVIIIIVGMRRKTLVLSTISSFDIPQQHRVYKIYTHHSLRIVIFANHH